MASTGKKINELTQISTVTDETVLPGVYVNSSIADSTASKISVQQLSAKVQNDMSGTLAGKQDKLTAGDNITISEQNVISSTAEALPSQTGNSGKFLTTNGSTASWETVSSGANTSLSNLTNDGKAVIANLSKPGTISIALSAPSSGTVMTAPADGYVIVRLVDQGLIALSSFINNTIDTTNLSYQLYSNKLWGVTIPVFKGQKYVWDYSGTPEFIRFVYAKGSEHEYLGS